MMVDCHTHIWTGMQQLGLAAGEVLARSGGTGEIVANPSAHAECSRCVNKTLVLGFASRCIGAYVPNNLIAEHVGHNSETMIGIAAVDPAEPDAVDEAVRCLDRKEFRGLTLGPAIQGFHPSDSRAMEIYELASLRGVPIFVCNGPVFPQLGRLEYARPFQLDEIAREFPKLTIVVSSMGLPWIEECLTLVGKHPRVFADIAGLLGSSWRAYNAMVLAHQSGVMDKLLFGSGFPRTTAAEAIEGLYRLREVTAGTNLPAVPREALRSIVDRDALELLGMTRADDAPVSKKADVEIEEEVEH
jgi:predicted TIM-barrel fold metal-dependent hydrolase